MSAIWPSDTEFISEIEFLDTIAEYDVDCRRGGTKYFFLNHAAQRTGGVPVAPQEVVDFVRTQQYKGRPIFQFIRSKYDPSRVGIRYTAAGRQMARDYEGWFRIVHRQPGEYDGFDS